MTNGYEAGQKIVARNTELNKRLGIAHKADNNPGFGYICHVKDEMVSFYFQRGTVGGRGWIEAKAEMGVFRDHFEVASTSINSGYAKSHHFQKRFPNSFQNI